MAPKNKAVGKVKVEGAVPTKLVTHVVTVATQPGGSIAFDVIPDPGDDAKPLAAPLQGHFAALCKIWARFDLPKGPIWRAGTGFVIGPGRVATAAHVLYDASHGGYASTVEITPAQAGNLHPYGMQSLKYPRIAVTQAFAKDPNSPYDVGLVFLGQPLPKTYLPLATTDGIDLTNANVSVAGYRQDLEFAHEHTAKVAGAAPLALYHRADTLEGQSGAPVMLQIGGQWTAVGIHVAGKEEVPSKFQPANSAVRLTKPIADWLKAPGPTV